jgi:hypothetical protein
VLCCAVLCCAVLCCAVLCCAVLCCAVLCCVALLGTPLDHNPLVLLLYILQKHVAKKTVARVPWEDSSLVREDEQAQRRRAPRTEDPSAAGACTHATVVSVMRCETVARWDCGFETDAAPPKRKKSSVFDVLRSLSPRRQKELNMQSMELGTTRVCSHSVIPWLRCRPVGLLW